MDEIKTFFELFRLSYTVFANTLAALLMGVLAIYPNIDSELQQDYNLSKNTIRVIKAFIFLAYLFLMFLQFHFGNVEKHQSDIQAGNLERQVIEIKAKMDSINEKLKPFIALAKIKYPAQSENDALKLILKDIRKSYTDSSFRIPMPNNREHPNETKSENEKRSQKAKPSNDTIKIPLINIENFERYPNLDNIFKRMVDSLAKQLNNQPILVEFTEKQREDNPDIELNDKKLDYNLFIDEFRDINDLPLIESKLLKSILTNCFKQGSFEISLHPVNTSSCIDNSEETCLTLKTKVAVTPKGKISIWMNVIRNKDNLNIAHKSKILPAIY